MCLWYELFSSVQWMFTVQFVTGPQIRHPSTYRIITDGIETIDDALTSVPTRVVWSREPLMMSSSLESRQLTSWLWPESSTLVPAVLLCTRILPSLLNKRKVDSFSFAWIFSWAAFYTSLTDFQYNKELYRCLWMYEATIFKISI